MALKDFLTISRAKIQLTSLPTAALGLTLGSTALGDLIQPEAFIYVLLFHTLLAFACGLNCACDLSVDEKYKRRLSDAVRALGAVKIKRILWFEVILSMAMIVWLAALRKNACLLLAALGLLAGIAYSMPPLRIKKRGAISFLPVMGGLYFLPVVGGWYLMTGQVTWFILLFGLGYALLMQGITVINTCEDFQEDEACGIATVAHVLGIPRTLSLGTGLVLMGGTLDICLLLGRMVDGQYQGGLRTVWILLFAALFIAAVVGISLRLSGISRSADPVALCKRSAPAMPLWFLATRYPLWAVALLSVSLRGR